MPRRAPPVKLPFAEPARLSGSGKTGTSGRVSVGMHHGRRSALVCLTALAAVAPASAAWIWTEGEAPAVNRMNRHPWWYDQVKRDEFSGGDFISNFSETAAGEAEYRIEAAAAGDYEFWVRANPLQAKLSYALNGGPDTPIALDRDQRGNLNVAADGKPDLRFLAWCKVGKVPLAAGPNTIRFRMDSANHHHGYLDCFVFSTDPFQPRGTAKPDQAAADAARDQAGWFPFDPPALADGPPAVTDLRALNEQVAGEHGFIGARDGGFIRTGDGQPVRFWGVNGPPDDLTDDRLRECARLLARDGVNLVRLHGGCFDPRGEVDPAKIRRAIRVVEAMKAEGIYSHFSIYFPLWLDPQPDHPWLKGYNGKQHAFAALMFNPEFQARYRKWWTALLTTPSPATGKRLVDDPAVAGLEMQNEDSFLFWTFSEANLPEPQLAMLETRFGTWLAKRHGSPAKALAAWPGNHLKRDDPAAGRIAFRPLWNVFTDRTARDRETVEFLVETQTAFYTETRAFLRQLGFKGLVTASNWTTASPEILGPLEKLSYTCGDFIDRHGYFGNRLKGDQAEWSVREGHTYADRSALRFDPEEPGKPKQVFHPAMDPHYNGLPSMISETTWCRPNRYRGEAPLYYAVYGALQHTDAIVHFALDGTRWTVKPRFFTQPWSLRTPAMMGQFPAAALIYRQGLIASGACVADVSLNRAELLQLNGTPLPQDAGFDELRLKDLPQEGAPAKPGQRLNPLLHFIGRTDVRFVSTPARTRLADIGRLADPAAQTVRSITGELTLDYGRGILTIDAPQAQGVSGSLRARPGAVETRDLSITSAMEPGHLVVVALDGRPLATSRRMLLQVMSEERESGFRSEAAASGLRRITALGADPWLVKDLEGTVCFKRADAPRLKVTALDHSGRPERPLGPAARIRLEPHTVYYLISSE